MGRFERVVFEVAEDAAERLTAELLELGTLGTEELGCARGRCRLAAYFHHLPDPLLDERWAACFDPGASFKVEEVTARDWLADYRRSCRPIRLGRHTVVDPREPGSSFEPELDAAPIRLRLPARNAFGTGSHESTRLVVELLDEVELEGSTVLDVGYGSGILSFYALRRGARWVVGCEVDPAAALVGAQSRALNDLAPAFYAGRVAGLAGTRFDRLLVNIIPESVADELPSLRRLLADDGLAVFSGALARDRLAAWGRLEENGFRLAQERRSGDWVACLVRPTESGGW